MIEIVPSILSADFTRLGEEIARLEQAGVKMFHIDVMDGHFVPNITVGPPVVASLRRITRASLDVHLMVAEPERYIGAFAQAGASQLSVHVEACPHLDRTLRAIQGEGMLAGAVINPATPVAALEEVLELADFFLLMSVNPGFGGQDFLPQTLRKARQLDRRRRELGLQSPIEIDGGVTLDNLPDIVHAGCDWVVAGSTVFHSPDPAETVAGMRQIAREALSVRV